MSQSLQSIVEKWLKFLSRDWQDISVRHESPAGRALYELARRGVAEAKCRFLAWSPDADFEMWHVGVIAGRWTKATPPEEIRDAFPTRRVGIVQEEYLAIRQVTAIGAVSAADILGLPILDRPIKFETSSKQVKRIVVVYSRSQFEPHTRQPLPIGSLIKGRVVQGRSQAGAISAANLAEHEDVDYEPEPLVSGASVAFAFEQAIHRCRDHLAKVASKGAKGDIEATDDAAVDALAKACRDFHHAGLATIKMYTAIGRDSVGIAGLVADPLVVDAIDTAWFDEVNAVGVAYDATLKSVHASAKPIMKSQILSASTRKYEEVLGRLRQVGHALEQFPGDCAKLDEPGLRNVMLVGLQQHYPDACGERFRRSGKTDICVQITDSDALVAECKRWTGPARCDEAVEQLLSYVPANDKLAALIFFNLDVKAFSAKVVQGAANQLRMHELFVEQPAHAFGDSAYFVFRRRSGSEDVLPIHLLCFDLYSG